MVGREDDGDRQEGLAMGGWKAMGIPEVEFEALFNLQMCEASLSGSLDAYLM